MNNHIILETQSFNTDGYIQKVFSDNFPSHEQFIKDWNSIKLFGVEGHVRALIKQSITPDKGLYVLNLRFATSVLVSAYVRASTISKSSGLNFSNYWEILAGTVHP
ncbi:hypothetical protein QTN25_009071 [Entamoeba marina]